MKIMLTGFLHKRMNKKQIKDWGVVEEILVSSLPTKGFLMRRSILSVPSLDSSELFQEAFNVRLEKISDRNIYIKASGEVIQWSCFFPMVK